MRALLLLALMLFAFDASADAIDINSASAEELDALPGIGPAKARAIVAEREANGPFTSLEELGEVKGIGAATLKRLAPFITLGKHEKNEPVAVTSPPMPVPPKPVPPKAEPKPAAVARPPRLDASLDTESPEGKLNLNLARTEDFQSLEGLSPEGTQEILSWRKSMGPFTSVVDLARVPNLAPELVETLQYFVTVRLAARDASEEALRAHGLSDIAAQAVNAARKKGRLRSKADLEVVPALSEDERALLNRLLWY